MKELDFDKYYEAGEPEKRERAFAWATAIGLQDVDGLKPSKYLLETAQRNIEGEITADEARQIIDEYYETKLGHDVPEDAKEADKVSARIVAIVNAPGFRLSPEYYLGLHKQIFDGVFSHAGEIRDVELTKREWVLNGDTVEYELSCMIEKSLAYEQLMLALADKQEASEWELRFYSYDDVANYDWGLAVVAGVFKALSLPKELMSKDGKSEKLDHDGGNCKKHVYAPKRLKLGEQRADVELAHGRPALTDDSGVCYYIGNRLEPLEDCVLVKYDEANRVEAIFDRDFRSRVLFEKLKK